MKMMDSSKLLRSTLPLLLSVAVYAETTTTHGDGTAYEASPSSDNPDLVPMVITPGAPALTEVEFNTAKQIYGPLFLQLSSCALHINV